MYFVLPVWLAAGFADYLGQRASNIATTSGAKEFHLLQFAEMTAAETFVHRKIFASTLRRPATGT
jgi:hypothetical protein